MGKTKRGKGTKLMALADRSGLPLGVCATSAYKRRWKVKRLFAWLGNFRRLVVRYERRAENYLGFVQLGCVVILLRYLR